MRQHQRDRVAALADGGAGGVAASPMKTASPLQLW